jgi:hypothetical protein
MLMGRLTRTKMMDSAGMTFDVHHADLCGLLLPPRQWLAGVPFSIQMGRTVLKLQGKSVSPPRQPLDLLQQ